MGRVPKSAWTLEGFKREEAARKAAGKSANGFLGELREMDAKTAIVHQLMNVDTKFLVAFSLGALTTAIFMKLGS